MDEDVYPVRSELRASIEFLQSVPLAAISSFRYREKCNTRDSADGTDQDDWSEVSIEIDFRLPADPGSTILDEPVGPDPS